MQHGDRDSRACVSARQFREQLQADSRSRGILCGSDARVELPLAQGVMQERYHRVRTVHHLAGTFRGSQHDLKAL